MNLSCDFPFNNLHQILECKSLSEKTQDTNQCPLHYVVHLNHRQGFVCSDIHTLKVISDAFDNDKGKSQIALWMNTPSQFKDEQDISMKTSQ